MLATVLATASAAAATVLATVPIAAAPAAAIAEDADEAGESEEAEGVAPGDPAMAAADESGARPPAWGGDTTKVALQRAQRARTPVGGMRAGSTRNVV